MSGAETVAQVVVFYDLGSFRLLMPGFSVAPVCQLAILRTKNKVYLPSDQLSLYVYGIGVADPRGQSVIFHERVASIEDLWRAGQIVSKLGSYERVTSETLGACYRAVVADPDPANASARVLIQWAVDRIGAGTYRDLIRARVPGKIQKTQEQHSTDVWAEIQRRDRCSER